MPRNLVHNKKEEEYWNRAKEIVRKSKGRLKNKWALVNYIYQRMLKKHRKG